MLNNNKISRYNNYNPNQLIIAAKILKKLISKRALMLILRIKMQMTIAVTMITRHL